MFLERGKIRRSNIEPVGCINSGAGPAVVHVWLPGMRIPDIYIVGAEMDLTDSETRVKAMRALRNGRNSVQARGVNRKVWVYESARWAKFRYEKLKEQAIARREREIAEIEAKREAARSGDLGATLDLSLGYGLA